MAQPISRTSREVSSIARVQQRNGCPLGVMEIRRLGLGDEMRPVLSEDGTGDAEHISSQSPNRTASNGRVPRSSKCAIFESLNGICGCVVEDCPGDSLW